MSQQCDTSTEVRHVRLRLSHSVCTASTRIDEHCPAALAEAEGIFQATLLLRILLHTVCSHSMQSQCAVTVCSHSVQSQCAVTVCSHSVQSQCAVTLCSHSVQRTVPPSSSSSWLTRSLGKQVGEAFWEVCGLLQPSPFQGALQVPTAHSQPWQAVSGGARGSGRFLNWCGGLRFTLAVQLRFSGAPFVW